MVQSFQPAEFLQLGLERSGQGVKNSQKTNLRRFRSFYKVCPETCSQIFSDLQTTDIEAARIDKANPEHLLMTLYWLVTYQSEEKIGGWMDGMGEKTVRKHIWRSRCRWRP
jgi:hypothetical protein